MLVSLSSLLPSNYFNFLYQFLECTGLNCGGSPLKEIIEFQGAAISDYRFLLLDCCIIISLKITHALDA